MNYRRLVGDRAWPATASFAALTDYFPGPLVVLRTLKSDVVVGLTDEVVAGLDATGQPWRTGGTHALVQARASAAGVRRPPQATSSWCKSVETGVRVSGER